MIKEYEKIMSTTEEGDKVVLIETRKNTYIRKRKGLQVIASEILKIKEVSTPRHQYQ